MARVIESDALWSDVDVPASSTGQPFHRWLVDHGLDPHQVLVRGAIHGEALVGIEAWVPDDSTLPQVASPVGSPDPLAWPAAGTTLALHGVNDVDALEDLAEVLNDSMIVPYTVEPQAVEFAPQAWRVLAHRAHWENKKLDAMVSNTDDDEAAYQLGRVSLATQRHPLDRKTFQKVRESFLTDRHRSSMTLDQYHAWFGRSRSTLAADGGLNATTLATLYERLTNLWQHQPVDEQQNLAQRLIKPHPLHAHLVTQGVERWHLQKALDTGPAASPNVVDERPRSRL